MKIHPLFDPAKQKEPVPVDGKKTALPLTNRLMKLVPCTPYKKGKKSRRVRKNKWVPANG